MDNACGRSSLTTWFCLLAATPCLFAQVGDPTIRTDHPQYAGEGALQTIADCVAFATAGRDDPQERAIALYNWLLAHQWHLMSPQEWCIPGRAPDTQQPRDYENVVYDANIGRFSYGYGLCGTVHAWNEPYWRALGMQARRRAFPGHVNSEVFYEGSWHAFDTDMAGLLFRRDGVVAGYADIIADPSLVDSVKPPHPHYPFAWPGDFQTMQRGWRQVADGGNWYSLYNGGYATQPGIIHLRAGETFTRWYDPDHYGGPSKRRFWHHMKNGPSRPWSFYGQTEPTHYGDTHNARNDVSYCNGEFVYRPEVTDMSLIKPGAPVAVFDHWSPYVIAGDPKDDANPMTWPATGGLVVTGKTTEYFQMRVSADNERGWHFIALSPEIRKLRRDPFRSLVPSGKPNKSKVAPQSFRFDLTEFVKGRFGWRVRITWSALEVPITDLKFTTVTQVCPSVYPRLTADGCEVTYRAASRGVVPAIPNFALPESEIDRFEATDLRSPNVTYHGRSEDNRFAYRTNDGKPGQVVFRVHGPPYSFLEPLTEVRAAIRYQLRVPPPENADYHLDISTDDGGTWQTFATADIPADNEHSSGWLAGRAEVSDADTNQTLVRVHLDAGGHKTGLIDARLYGIHRTAAPGPLTITYGWKENGQPRQHTETIAAGAREATFTVPTGTNVTDDFVRLAAE